MVKLDTKWIFWSLAVHRYPIKPHFLSIFKARGPGMKLIIDGNFIAKKMKIYKNFWKIYVIYIKRKLRTCRIQIQDEKVWFFEKNPQILKFFRFWSKGGTLWSRSEKFTFFKFSKFSEFFFEKWPQGVLGNVKRNKVMKYELIWSVRQGVTQDHLHVRVDCNSPHTHPTPV